MAAKTLQQTASQADVQDADIFAVARSTGPLSHVTGSAIVTYLLTALATSTGFLKRASNLSDVADVPTARTNLGVQPTVAPSFTGGVTVAGGVVQSGPTVQSVQAVAATTIDVTLQDFQTKSIAVNTTFTLSGWTAAKAQGVMVRLIASAGAVPVFTGVQWAGGALQALGDGTHVLGFVTFDGGSTVQGFVGGVAFS